MKLCDFCLPFYSSSKATSGIKGKVSQPAIAEFFMSTALGEMAKIELVFSEDLFRKWFKGEREPNAKLWAKVAEVYDETRFSRTVSSKLNEKMLPNLVSAFGIEIGKTDVADKFAFSAALAKQFGDIARGNGEAESIVSEIYRQCLNVKDFPDYVTNSQAKYSKLKTLLYTSEERPFEDFFVCNTISQESSGYHPVREGLEIKDVTLEKLLKISPFTILIGMAGIGKTMMLRHLFLTSIKKYAQSGKLPILVTLRGFGQDNSDLFNVIVDSVHRFDITFSAAHVHKFLAEGKCQLLMDGLDEIKANDMDSFQRQLDTLIDRYPKNQYVISTRGISSFIEFPRFAVLHILPFSKDQALELIDHLEFYPGEPKIKQQFRDKLASEYFESHEEFATNPLLLTLMLMSFHSFADVPSKKHSFYEQAYQTLLQKHDASKLAYKRALRSVNDPSDFTTVFREFCAKTYRKSVYAFDRPSFDKHFRELKALDRMESSIMKPDNFLFDVCNNVCLMFEEGEKYHFLHRSFQEYFFADYYARQDDTTLVKLGNYIGKQGFFGRYDSEAFDMLYMFAPEKVERFIIMPFLASIYDGIDNIRGYWLFLGRCCGDWLYETANDEAVAFVKEHYHFTPQDELINCFLPSFSIIPTLIFKIINVDLRAFELEKPNPELLSDELMIAIQYGKLQEDNNMSYEFFDIEPLRLKNAFFGPKDFKSLKFDGRIVLDANGKPADLGYIYQFPFDFVLSDPDKYSAMKAFWEKDTCPAWNIYYDVANYYHQLKNKYAHADDLDGDDF